MFTREEVKTASKEQLKGRWGIVGGLFLVITILLIGIQFIPYIGFLGNYIMSGACTLSYIIICFKVIQREPLGIEDAFSGFKNFGKSIGLFFWQLLWVFLWTLLFIIPGIIKSYSYCMSFYILADHPEITVREALNESKRMTQGHKMDLFILQLSFIGWGILATLTFGIGYFWLIPYMQVTMANTYKKLANQ
ncbi:MAG: DUF975 family protein [Zhenhengia sp.]|mgnify:FL=1|jgi:uncharacterized membrane protein|uniref:DUF975 family protein n=1 Tax=Zhenhengia sp. TaxID=2944208 RepID=UPI002910D8B8|nr:DUF975 family protein [Clostridiales bacterium]MDU6975990.1 DUF975 family protein [Clostridiales bacterium]